MDETSSVWDYVFEKLSRTTATTPTETGEQRYLILECKVRVLRMWHMRTMSLHMTPVWLPLLSLPNRTIRKIQGAGE
jgi:hypothetical protein